jgi:UDP-N-acetylmuramyl pentapeptide synthase
MPRDKRQAERRSERLGIRRRAQQADGGRRAGAMRRLGAAARARSRAGIVAITGSVGKTGTK